MLHDQRAEAANKTVIRSKRSLSRKQKLMHRPLQEDLSIGKRQYVCLLAHFVIVIVSTIPPPIRRRRVVMLATTRVSVQQRHSLDSNASSSSRGRTTSYIRRFHRRSPPSISSRLKTALLTPIPLLLLLPNQHTPCPGIPTRRTRSHRHTNIVKRPIII